LVIVIELKTMQGKAAKNFTDDKIQLKPIATSLLISEFDFLPLRLNEQGTEIVEIKSFPSEADKITAVGKLGINTIYGLSVQLGVNILPEKVVAQIKEKGKMEKLYALYTEKERRRQENDDSLKIVKEKTQNEFIDKKKLAKEQEKLKKEQDKEEKEKQTESEKKKKEQIANKWNTKLNLSISSNYVNEKTEEETLTERVVTNRSDLTSSVTLKPTMKSLENGEIQMSASYKNFTDLLNSANNTNKARYDYTKSKLFGDTYTLELCVGDINLENNSYIILNKKYRGYYGGVQYYLNYNPEKWSYKEKVKNGEISDKSVKGIRISALYAPSDKEKFLGDTVSETETGFETKGFLSEIFMKNKYPTNTQEYHLGYVYGGATEETATLKLNNYAQMILLEQSYLKPGLMSIKSQASITTATREEAGTTTTATSENSGQRIEVAASLNTVQAKNDYFNSYGKFYYSSDGFDTGLLSKLSGGVPAYVKNDSLKNGYGYELRLGNSMYGKKIENGIGVSINEKKENGEYAGSYKKFYIQNKLVITPKDVLYTGYNSIMDFSERKNMFNLRYVKKYNLKNISEDGIFTPTILYSNRYYDDKKTDEVYGLKINNISTLKIKSYKMPTTAYSYYNQYSVTDENTIGMGLNTTIKKVQNIEVLDPETKKISSTVVEVEKMRGMLGVAKYNKDSLENPNYLAVTNRESSNLIIKDNFDLFKEDIRLDYNINNYYYTKEKANINTANIIGTNTLATVPYQHGKLTTFNLFSGKMNKDSSDINNSQQSNFKFQTENEYKIDKKLTIFGNYKFADNTITENNILPTKATVDVYETDTATTITDINSQISKNESEITRENTVINDMEAGVKYQIKGKEELTKENPIKIYLGASGGYETKYIKNLETTKGAYFGLLTEGRVLVNKYNQAAFKVSIKPVFDQVDSGLLKTKYSVNVGAKTLIGSFQNIGTIKIEKETFAQKKQYDTTDIEIIDSGNWTPNEKNQLQYQLKYIDKSLTEAKNATLELLYKSNIYKAEDKNKAMQEIAKLDDIADELKLELIEKIKEEKNWISAADIYVSGQTNYKQDKISTIKLYTLTSGGMVNFYEGLNIINVSGSLTKKQDDFNTTQEEYSKFSIKDTQRVGFDMNLGSMCEYYVYKNAADTTNKKIVISANISKTIKFFTASLSAQQETELRTDINKNKRLYTASIRASF
jgi:hypothetical protein